VHGVFSLATDGGWHGKPAVVVCLCLQELGVSIMSNLHSQRQTILHARDTLHGADDNIAKARRVLSTMSRRIMTNKIIMFGIILLLLGAVGLVIYYKFVK
jgi:vesicle transport through interaction with t-SNAREs 1